MTDSIIKYNLQKRKIHLKEIDIPLEPAIKPKIRAFSGRVTLFAVLNISCASNICSRCNPITKQ